MDFGSLALPGPVAMALVALLGYLVGYRRRPAENDLVVRSRREMQRAQMVAAELDRIAGAVRHSLSRHQAILCRFKDNVGKLGQQQQEAAWKQLCQEVDEILRPTLRLANQIATASEEIRQQTVNLMSFTEVRTDPLTGVTNRRGLEDALVSQLALLNRYATQFSLAMFDVDHFKQLNDRFGHLEGDRMLKELAQLMDECARETDFVGRYGGEEFLIIMPQTNLEGACAFSERLRAIIEGQLRLTVSAGVATANDGDTRDSLLTRADDALYSAKAAGRNMVFRHTGEEAEPVVQAVAAE